MLVGCTGFPYQKIYQPSLLVGGTILSVLREFLFLRRQRVQNDRWMLSLVLIKRVCWVHIYFSCMRVCWVHINFSCMRVCWVHIYFSCMRVCWVHIYFSCRFIWYYQGQNTWLCGRCKFGRHCEKAWTSGGCS